MAKKLAFIWALALLIFVMAACPALASDADTDADYYSVSDNWAYTLVHEVEIANSAVGYAFQITIRVPLLDLDHPLYNQLIGEQITPYPDYIETDADGHRFAVYKIDSLKGKSTLKLTQKYALDVSALSYTFDRNLADNTYSSRERTLYQRFLRPENGVESTDPAIMAFAEAAVGNETNPYLKARALFSAVNLQLNYTEEIADQNALATLNRGSGNCEGYTNLLVASMRAAGIPAKRLNGYLYQPEKHANAAYYDEAGQRLRVNTLRHTWAEFYLPDLGWVIADPTFTYTYTIDGTAQKYIDLTYFANIGSGRRYISFFGGNRESEKITCDAIGGKEIVINFSAYLATGKQYLPFNDLEGHWAALSVRDCVEEGLFYGVSAALFAPDMPMTRAMFVSVLGRYYQMHGGQIRSYNPTVLQFTDIHTQGYYADYLGWAVDNGLIQGYGDGLFGPDDMINREQMATIISALMQLMQANDEDVDENVDVADEDEEIAFPDEEVPLADDPALPFADKNSISSWAREGVAFCAAANVITGEPDGNFYPQRSATRAQVAAILQRLPY